MRHFSILAFSINFSPIKKLTCLVTLFDNKLQIFKNSPKLTIFGIFNELLSTQNVMLAMLNATFSVVFKHCAKSTICYSVINLYYTISFSFQICFFFFVYVYCVSLSLDLWILAPKIAKIELVLLCLISYFVSVWSHCSNGLLSDSSKKCWSLPSHHDQNSIT